ncbi:MAG: hybrid sensor histidine kinase/response regulator [Bacteroidetes bacterium]|nr:hybrid sensor histidine kinase/response regulator [Bacteroidota bacterium]
MENENYKILAVDDNPKNLKVLAALLAPQSYKVDYAFSGPEAINILEAESYDLILLDIMMPGMDGYETCVRIRSMTKNNLVPVIFLTARTDMASLNKAFTSGGVDYITKPFSPEELLARVRTHLELKSSRQQLLEVNSWLEMKVKERTEALRSAHEELEKAYRSLQSLDKAKTDFLHMIHHEVRTPLNSILGFTLILQDEVEQPEVKEHVDFIFRSSKRLEKFLAVVLQLTELIARDHPLQKNPVSLHKILEMSLNEYILLTGKKGINTMIDPGLTTIIVEGNEKLLRNCLLGIVENAIEYSPESGEIRIRLITEKGFTGCEISDQGPGFSEQALKNLFTLFGLGNEHIDENVGLDLCLAKMIMDAHGGKVEACNNPEGGASVKLMFPAI